MHVGVEPGHTDRAVVAAAGIAGRGVPAGVQPARFHYQRLVAFGVGVVAGVGQVVAAGGVRGDGGDHPVEQTGVDRRPGDGGLVDEPFDDVVSGERHQPASHGAPVR